MDAQIDALIFSLEVSQRYHTARRDFLQFWIKANQFLTLFFSASVTAYFANYVPSWMGQGVVATFAAILFAISLVSSIVDLEKKAQLHQSLSDQFRELKNRIKIAESKQVRPNDVQWVRQQIAEWSAEREAIEADEPQMFCALHDDVRYQTAKAFGRTANKSEAPDGIKRLLRHYLPFSDPPG